MHTCVVCVCVHVYGMQTLDFVCIYAHIFVVYVRVCVCVCMCMACRPLILCVLMLKCFVVCVCACGVKASDVWAHVSTHVSKHLWVEHMCSVQPLVC